MAIMTVEIIPMNKAVVSNQQNNTVNTISLVIQSVYIILLDHHI